MKLDSENLLNLEKYWALPVFLGFTVGFAIFVFKQVYEILHEIFSTIIGIKAPQIWGIPESALD